MEEYFKWMKQKECHKYDDIIHLPHHVSVHHPHMEEKDRAAQFSPFSALTGHGAAITETGRFTENKALLDDEYKSRMNEKLLFLSQWEGEKPEVMITYFVPDERKPGGSYERRKKQIRKLDMEKKTVEFIDGMKIFMDNIMELEWEGILGEND